MERGLKKRDECYGMRQTDMEKEESVRLGGWRRGSHLCRSARPHSGGFVGHRHQDQSPEPVSNFTLSLSRCWQTASQNRFFSHQFFISF